MLKQVYQAQGSEEAYRCTDPWHGMLSHPKATGFIAQTLFSLNSLVVSLLFLLLATWHVMCPSVPPLPLKEHTKMLGNIVCKAAMVGFSRPP